MPCLATLHPHPARHLARPSAQMPREAIVAQLHKMKAHCAPGGALLVMHVAPRGPLFSYQHGGLVNELGCLQARLVHTADPSTVLQHGRMNVCIPSPKACHATPLRRPAELGSDVVSSQTVMEVSRLPAASPHQLAHMMGRSRDAGQASRPCMPAGLLPFLLPPLHLQPAASCRQLPAPCCPGRLVAAAPGRCWIRWAGRTPPPRCWRTTGWPARQTCAGFCTSLPRPAVAAACLVAGQGQWGNESACTPAGCVWQVQHELPVARQLG